jgi:hypothetical protein
VQIVLELLLSLLQLIYKTLLGGKVVKPTLTDTAKQLNWVVAALIPFFHVNLPKQLDKLGVPAPEHIVRNGSKGFDGFRQRRQNGKTVYLLHIFSLHPMPYLIVIFRCLVYPAPICIVLEQSRWLLNKVLYRA